MGVRERGAHLDHGAVAVPAERDAYEEEHQEREQQHQQLHLPAAPPTSALHGSESERAGGEWGRASACCWRSASAETVSLATKSSVSESSSGTIEPTLDTTFDTMSDGMAPLPRPRRPLPGLSGGRGALPCVTRASAASRAGVYRAILPPPPGDDRDRAATSRLRATNTVGRAVGRRQPAMPSSLILARSRSPRDPGFCPFACVGYLV